jgi:tetratricopeptide (TPR) repeat protein
MFHILAILLFISSSIFSNEDAKKGNEAYENADYPLAEEYYRSAIEEEPENAQVYFNLGNALAKQGKVKDAIKMYLQYNSMVESPEEKSQGEYNIGTILSETEQWKPAVKHFRNALTLNPFDTEAKHNFEKALMESQKQEQEEQDKENKKQEPPSEYAKAVKAQAEEFVRQKKYKQAYDLMLQALDIDKSVQNYNEFTQRIGAVNDIDS